MGAGCRTGKITIFLETSGIRLMDATVVRHVRLPVKVGNSNDLNRAIDPKAVHRPAQ
jgi:hypothetical protein